MEGTIYKITNPNGRIYIGKTTNIKLRFSDYRRLRCSSQPALYNSFLKYGVDNHTFEILFESNNISNDELSKFEIAYISLYDSHMNGLNCTIGGDSGFMPGDLNVAKKPEVRKKMSETKKLFYKNGGELYIKGKKHSIDSINKIKEKRALQKITKPILDTNTGIFYDTIKELNELIYPDLKYKTLHRRIIKGSLRDRFIV